MRYLTKILFINALLIFPIYSANALDEKKSEMKFTLSDYKKALENKGLAPEDFESPTIDQEDKDSGSAAGFVVRSKKTVNFENNIFPSNTLFAYEGEHFKFFRSLDTREDRTITFMGMPCDTSIYLNERGQFCYCILSKPYTLKGHTIKEGSIHYIGGKFNGFIEKEKGISKFFTFNEKDEVVEKDVKKRDILMDDCGLSAN